MIIAIQYLATVRTLRSVLIAIPVRPIPAMSRLETALTQAPATMDSPAVDTCSEVGGCTHEWDTTIDGCDSVPCTQDQNCIDAVKISDPNNPGEQITDYCTISVCEAGSCVFSPVDCDDGNVCTNDTCVNLPSGSDCTHTPVNCSDGDNCTDDVCDSHWRVH